MKYVSLFAVLCLAGLLLTSCGKEDDIATPTAREIVNFEVNIIDIESIDDFRFVVTVGSIDPEADYYYIRTDGSIEPFNPTDTLRMLWGEQIAMDINQDQDEHFEQVNAINPSVVVRAVWYKDYDRDYCEGMSFTHIYYFQNLALSIQRNNEIVSLPSGFCEGPPQYKKGFILIDKDTLVGGNKNIHISRAPSVNPNWGAVGIFTDM